MKLTGNTILITGGTSGIGLELATRLMALGNSVIITGRDADKLAAAEKHLPGIHTIVSDVSDIGAIAALHAQVTTQFPALNVLINNAGIMHRQNLNHPNLDLSSEIDINLKGPIEMVAAFLDHLKSKPTAAIMNVSSGVAFVPLPISPVYSATKFALHAYTLSLRVQLQRTTVKVFELMPPATATPLLGGFPATDFGGVPIMPVEKMVSIAIKAIEADTLEIRPGSANLLKWMNRIAPSFILGQLSKSAERMLDEPKG